jgi:hypothetical protein
MRRMACTVPVKGAFTRIFIRAFHCEVFEKSQHFHFLSVGGVQAHARCSEIRAQRS